MICPECDAVYREGFIECYDCQVPLVPGPPEGEEEPAGDLDTVNPVIVYATGNPVALALAKSLLEEAEIEYWTSGEEVQFLLGAGGAGTGFNPTTGPVKVSVMPPDVESAAQILDEIDERDLEDQGAVLEEDEEE